MTPDQSTVVGALVATGASVYLGGLATGRPLSVKPAVGVFAAGVVLISAAGGGGQRGELAAQFAVLIATTALLTSGYAAVAALGRYFSPPKG